tara:strand:+ start:21 stop:503 length:483 start_codon:yes stop_codon:yes gene_type:complete
MKLHGDKDIYNLADFGKAAPQFGFSRPINKIVIKNREALWLCTMIAQGGAGALDGVPFEVDDDFKKFAKVELKKEDSEKLTNLEIKTILLKWVAEALDIHNQLDKDDMIKVWMVEEGEEANNVKDGIGAIKSKGKKELKDNRINRAKYREMGDGFDWQWK